jgi:glycosyltransferase involved in cell wall biosynthesis
VNTTPDAASISVVVPVFEDVGRLGDALTGIVEQTLCPGEIVVADDCSKDGTDGFVREFAARHQQALPIRYVRLPERGGDAKARDAGIAAAGGDWIAICDSDDIWAAAKLERQLSLIAGWQGRRRLVLLGTHGFNVNDAKRVISPAIMGPTNEAQYDAVRRRGGLFYLIHSSVLFSRADFERVGGYSCSEYGPASEFDLFCRMAELGVVINLPEPLVYYRKRAGSMQLDSFWERNRNVARLTANQRRRAAGQPPISEAEFSAKLAAAPIWTRTRRRSKALGMYYYRRGATDMVNGRRARGAVELTLAALLDWGRLLAGARNAVRPSPRPRADASAEEALLD